MSKRWWFQVWTLVALSILSAVGALMLAVALSTVDPGFGVVMGLLAGFFAFWACFNIRELWIAKDM